MKWELNYKEDWASKNWCFSTVVLEKILESPLDCKEIKPVKPKGNQSWILTGRTEAEAEALILWPLMQRANSLEKTLMLAKIEGRRRRGRQKMKLCGWHPKVAHECEQALGDGEGQGSLAFCSPWGCKESDMTEWLNDDSIKIILKNFMCNVRISQKSTTNPSLSFCAIIVMHFTFACALNMQHIAITFWPGVIFFSHWK